MNPLLPVIDRIVYLAGGRAASGTTSEVVRTPVLSALYGHHVDVLRVHGRVLVVAGAAGEFADSSDHAHVDSPVEIIS
jgi:zinc/manganese transport system ATP-binding protein